jgi:glutamine cyclotransferase
MIVFACSDSTSVPPSVPPDSSGVIQPADTFVYHIVNIFPHDTGAFTQGLIYVDSVLIEGTGAHLGLSKLRRVELETGDVLQQVEMPAPYFGEGVTLWGDSIIQLTWRDSLAIIYEEDTFAEIGRFYYDTEGWGLTHDGMRLIMSDGTSTIYFRDPNTFVEIGRIDVSDETGPLIHLNELEYINGHIFANVWLTDFIAVISPQTGKVVRWIDLTGLLANVSVSRMQTRILNGIAYDAVNRRLFVTGKLWPRLYEIELVPKE